MADSGYCVACGRPLAVAQTKAATGAAQWALACSFHGRVDVNWHTSSTAAAAAKPVDPKKPSVTIKFHAAPV
jgi:hypothetical protein